MNIRPLRLSSITQTRTLRCANGTEQVIESADMHMSDHLKQQIKGKMQERDRLEATILECSTRLEAAGVGLYDKLVDQEGFPRADIDVSAARADRQQVAVLTNDHKRVTSQIEQLMHDLHAEARRAPVVNAAKRPTVAELQSSLHLPPQTTSTAAAIPATALRPFAVVDEVSSSSPAQEAGVAVGDQFIAFANITGQTQNTLPAVAAALQAYQNKEVVARVLRRGNMVELKLTPHTWDGRGLLGCHLRPL